MTNNYPPVLILAGGLGTRISHAYPNIPKYLVPINDEPFALHQLRLLKKMGFNEIVLCVGYKKELIKTLLGDGKALGLRIQYSEDSDQPLGTGGAIKKAAQLVSSPFAVLYGDSYLDFDFKPVFHTFLDSQKSGLMTVYHNKNLLGKSNVAIKNNEVIFFDKENQTPDMDYIDYGFSLYSDTVFNCIKETSFDLSIVVKKLVRDKNLIAYEINHRFYEAGTVDGITDLEALLQGSD